ncbi:MAG: cell division protein FtsQ/DivIB [Hyphomonas sp.]
MPKVNRNSSGRRRAATITDHSTGQEVRVTSVIFGLVLLIGIIVGTAAWMGGSMSQIENRFSGFMDDTARMTGIAVNDVSIIGLDQNPALVQDVRAAAMIEPGENMFRADPHVIRRRVEATRKVLNVRVHRLWPDQVVIIADAAEPVALWHDGTDWAVVDGLGRIMPGARADDQKPLLRLAGPGAAKAAPDLVTALAETPDVSTRVAIATRIKDRRWDMHLINGSKVLLPEDDEMSPALKQLERMQIRTALMQRGVDSIDLRNSGRIYLKPTDDTSLKQRLEAARS